MSHVFAVCVKNVKYVVLTVLLFRTYRVYCLQENFGPSMAFLTSIYRTSNRQPSPSESPYSYRGTLKPEAANIYLGKQPKYSIFIPLVTNKLSANSEDIFEERGMVGVRNFSIEAPPGYGIIAVIQALDLGLPPLVIDTDSKFKGKDNKGNCNNYVKFGDGEGLETDEICGRMVPYDKEFQPVGLIGPRTFTSSTGKMIVSFRFGELSDFLRYNYHTMLRRISSEDLDKGLLYQLAISFTSFRDCQSDEPDAVVPCVSYEGVNSSCISAGHMCDNVFNCGFENDFGIDEKYCSELKDSEKIGKIDSEQLELPKYLNYWTIRPDEDYEDLTILNPIKQPDLNYTNYSPSLDRHLQYNLTPISTILLIVITVVFIMILGIIIRFCCKKCVGIPLPIPNSTVTDMGEFSSSTALSSSTMLQDSNVDIQMSPYQCSLRNYELDLPPSYDELFPSSKLNSSISFIDVSAIESNLLGSSDLVKVPEEN